MRTCVTLVLAMLSSLFLVTAQAQESQPLPSCYAKPDGTGSYTYKGIVPNVGEWSYHVCPDPYKPYPAYVLRRFDYVIKHPDQTKGFSFKQIYEAYWKLNVTSSIFAPNLKELKDAADAHRKTNTELPAPPLWKVTKTSTQATSPEYAAASDGWIWCADEGELCKFPRGALVKYGVGEVQTIRQLYDTEIRCNAPAFGVAATAGVKECGYAAFPIKGDIMATRATVGATCDCSDPYTRFVLNGYTYCRWKIDSPGFARCSKG